MVKKTDIVREAIAIGDLKKALRIAKGFRINVTKEQRELMTRAYECMIHPEFYRQIGLVRSLFQFSTEEIVVAVAGPVYGFGCLLAALHLCIG